MFLRGSSCDRGTIIRGKLRTDGYLLMAPHIVSLGDHEICMSPVLSSVASIVSFDTTFSEMPPTASETSGTHGADLEAEHANLLGGRKTPRGEHAAPDDLSIKHHAYFFNDGNVTFLVRGLLCFIIPHALTILQIDGTLYCVHQYFFSRDSTYFSERFAKLGVRDHEVLPIIISRGDVERNAFEAFLSILYPA